VKTRRRGHDDDDDDEGDESENGGDGWCADFLLFFTRTPPQPQMDSPIDAPSAKRTQTTLETVPGLDDAAHLRIDDAVFKFFEDEPIHETLRTLSTLLATIVEILENSEGRLDPKYMRITPSASSSLAFLAVRSLPRIVNAGLAPRRVAACLPCFVVSSLRYPTS
jgi:hypothetical protein